MDMDHLGLKLLEILLQTLQLICGFFICSDGLVGHAEGTDDALQRSSNEALYARRQSRWVQSGSDGLFDSDRVEKSRSVIQ